MFETKFITNEEMESLKYKGFTLIFVFANHVCYENALTSEKYSLKPLKKEVEFYYVLTVGGNLIFTDDLKQFSNKVKNRYITCVYDYDDELDLKNDSYRFITDVHVDPFTRFKTTFYDIATEVLVLDEKVIKQDIETD